MQHFQYYPASTFACGAYATGRRNSRLDQDPNATTCAACRNTEDWAYIDQQFRAAAILAEREAFLQQARKIPEPELKRFALTFGSKYAHEAHAVAPRWMVNPDGWVLILAPDEMEARRIVFSVFGPAWAFLRPERLHHPEMYPVGITTVIDRASKCRHCGLSLSWHDLTEQFRHDATGTLACPTRPSVAEPDTIDLTPVDQSTSTEQDAS